MTSNAAAAFSAAPAAPAAPAGAPTAATPAAPAAPALAAPAAPAPAPTTPAANGAWYDGFENAEVKTWTQAKGFKDASAVAESAYNLEKLIGHDKAGRTLVIPKDDASPEELKAFHAKLGVPDSPDGYQLPVPEGADPAFAKTAAQWMHEAGVPPKQAAALAEKWNAFAADQQKQQNDKLISNSDKAFSDTTARWGKDADANLELGKRFVSQLMPAEIQMDDGTKVPRQQFLERVFNTTGATAAMLELFAKAGKGMGEHAMHQGGTPAGGVMSPQAAQAKITALKGDSAWLNSYLNGDKAKLAEMTRLNEIAFGQAQ